MLNRKSASIALVTMTAMLLGGGAAFAGETLRNYSTTVGAFNGNGYTAYQTKSITGAAGELYSGSVGGNYTVDARMESSATDGDWVSQVTDDGSYYLYNKSAAGSSVRVQFSNDWTTPVDVQVSGSWRSR